MIALMVTLASANTLPAEHIVLHDGRVEGGVIRWTTRWVDPPPSVVPLAGLLPASTTSSSPAALQRGSDGQVVALAPKGWALELVVPQPVAGHVIVPLWAGGALQRVTLRGGTFTAPSVEVAPEVHHRLDRAGGAVPSGAAVVYLRSHGTAAVPGRAGRPSVWLGTIGWVTLAGVVSLLAARLGRPVARRRLR